MRGPVRPQFRQEQLDRILAPRRHLAQLRYVPRALGLVWEAAAGWALASTVLLVIQGLLPVLSVYLTRVLVNALVVVIESSGEPGALGPALIAAALMGAVLILDQLLGGIQEYVRMLLAERTQDHMNGLIHTKAIALDLQFFESPASYDQLQRASVEAIDRPLALLDNLNSLLQNTITLLAMGGVLLTFAWWMPLLLLVSTLPALWAAVVTNWDFHIWRQRNTVNQRRAGYCHHVLTTSQPAAELRLFGLGPHFQEAYSQLRCEIRAGRIALLRRQLGLRMLANLFGLLSLALALGWIVWQSLQRSFNLGDLAMFWQTMSQGQRLMRGLLTGLSGIYHNLLFLEDLFGFLDLEPLLPEAARPASLPPGLRQGIQISEVTFSYPYSERVALQGFNLTIPAGQIVAIVGVNGAGKSTLLKLLCRFYDPQEGRITWDGVDLRALAQADLRRRISVLFQQPFAYHDSVRDNIGFGDPGGQLTQAQIEAAAAAGGAAEIIARLPQGYATLLGKWFGSTDLSVGEWQRLALARAFVRQADLVILDEPTSAMDSWAENAWMGRFRNLVAGRTALIVTHRFTTAMQADMIHVMVDGRVVESGTHGELVAAGGRYAESWQMQMREAYPVSASHPAGAGRSSADPAACPGATADLAAV